MRNREGWLRKNRRNTTCSDFDQVAGRIVGLREFVEPCMQELERLLGKGVDEPVLAPEEAVDRAARSADLAGDGADRKCSGPALGDDPLGGGDERHSGPPSCSRGRPTLASSDGVGSTLMDIVWTNGTSGQYNGTAVAVQGTRSGGLTAGIHGATVDTSGTGAPGATWDADNTAGFGQTGGVCPLYCPRSDVVAKRLRGSA
jgi:hypothetical protein